MAGELREVDADGALAQLDALGAELAPAAGGGPDAEVEALRDLLVRRHGFSGDREDYYHPDNSMLDIVLERRKGLPILLSTVYVEVARRAGISVAGVGLPGHFVVAHFGQTPPLLFDPFGGGAPLAPSEPLSVPASGPHKTVMRMLNNLVRSYGRRADLTERSAPPRCASSCRWAMRLEPCSRPSCGRCGLASTERSAVARRG